MCDSIQEGGQRCVTSTRPGYQALIKAIDAAKAPFGTPTEQRHRARNAFSAPAAACAPAGPADDAAAASADQMALDPENALNTAIAHASTRTGQTEVRADIERYHAEGDTKTVAFLNSALRRGQERADAAKAVKVAVRKEREKVKRKLTGSTGKLTRSTKATETWNMEAVFPGVAEWWDYEKNEGIKPTEVTPAVNKEVWLTCTEGHSFSSRGNNLTAPLRRTGRRFPLCPECNGRRARQFEATQANMQALVDAIDDPEAFNALTPALRLELMKQLGYLDRGGEVQRELALTIAHGDLTLAEVMNANKWDTLADRVFDTDEDRALAGTSGGGDTDAEIIADRTTRIARVMGAAGAASLLDEDSDLARHMARENIEHLWNEVYDNPTEVDQVLAEIRAEAGRSTFATALADQFETEVSEIATAPLPDGFNPTRLEADGTTKNINPTLAQRRFMVLAGERRRFMNFSDTGAGKTVSATLAVQAAGANETIVIAPKAVLPQWEKEFTDGFGDRVEIRRGLPTGDETPPAEGINRVWVTNFDKFQGDPEEIQRRLAPLAGRVDAIVYDEIHLAKSRDSAETSKRRTALENFTDTAGAANPDLMVLGLTATPVVNDLSEAQSLLRLVEGRTSKGFPTTPTAANAAKAHLRLAAAGMRHKPTYPVGMTKTKTTVDVTDRLPAITASIQEHKRRTGSPIIHPSAVERALLPAKLDAITTAVRNAEGPSLVYTHYVEGMVEPMRSHFEGQGMRVGVYTGSDNDTTRAETLARFKNGEYDVLIGSGPIATGVDGLQNVSNNLVVASAPWTDAADRQLIGRLNRRGQTRDVNVTYVLTEAKVGDLTWSWCRDHRMKRLEAKGDLANAATDGHFADSLVAGEGAGVDDALKGLYALRKESAVRSVSPQVA